MKGSLVRNAALSIILVISLITLFLNWKQNLETLTKPHWDALAPDLPSLDASLATTNTYDLTESRNRPVFWQSRRPTNPAKTTTAEPRGDMELLGIVDEERSPVALLRIKYEKSLSPVLRLRKGQSINSFILMKIEAEEVTLSTPDGVIQTLKLKRGNTPLQPQIRPQPASR